MKTISLLFALLIAACPPLVASEAAFFWRTEVFRQGNGGVHTYRIPALIETQKGVLIAVADARHDSNRDLPARISLVMRRSVDGGKHWEPARTIREVNEGGVGDASLLLDRSNGRVWCFHNYGPPGIGFQTAKPGARTGPTTLQFQAIHSDDDGATWSEAIDFTPQVKDPSWQAMFSTSGTDIQISSGRFLVPLVMRDAQGIIHSLNAYSDDHGKTWNRGEPIGKGTDESHNVELQGGIILQNMRNGRTRAIASSHDGGVFFGPVSHDPALIDPGCNAGITRYHSAGKDILVFTNAASTRRENLTVKLSYDGGRTWPVARVIDAGPAGYSTVIPLHDGTIGVLYERGETNAAERIAFARFNLAWVTESRRQNAPGLRNRGRVPVEHCRGLLRQASLPASIPRRSSSPCALVRLKPNRSPHRSSPPKSSDIAVPVWEGRTSGR
ncbi:MAG TPA: sialidase family protein, partial [Bryobacteraceae bacterium]|nr:sialidase family protein [Bryobacteraceae bacterium]